MLNVLIVDDEKWAIDSFMETVKDMNVNVVGSACSGEEAVAFVKKNPSVSVAVLDIEMPGMTGIKAAEEIKKLRPDISIMYITSFGGKYFTEAYKNGYDELLMKPYTEEQLQKAFTKVISVKVNAKLRAQLFDTFSVTYLDEPLQLPVKKSYEVLAYCIVRADQEVDKEELCSVLWENSDKKSAMTSLRVCISNIKLALTGLGLDPSQYFATTKYTCTARRKNIDCEYLDYLEGKLSLEETSYDGLFLPEYAKWTKDTAVQLMKEKFLK